jgi:hypothetical protein
MMLRGYIDESYDGAAIPKVFNLSCLVTSDAGWVYFEMDWLDVIARKNEQLKKEGRKQITRFHASPFNNYQGDFKGWTPQEQRDFSEELVRVFKRNPVHIHGWSMPLQLLVQEFPEVKLNPVGFAYMILLAHLMEQIGETTLRLYPQTLIGLHHDQSDYDAVLQGEFNYLLQDSTFKRRNHFTYLQSEQSELCPRLQPADFIAFENFKEAYRPYSNRNRRGSLSALIDLASVSGRSRGFTLEGIRELKKIIDALHKESKEALFEGARI